VWPHCRRRSADRRHLAVKVPGSATLEATGDRGRQDRARPPVRQRRRAKPQREHTGTKQRGQDGEAEDQEVPHVAWLTLSLLPAGRRPPRVSWRRNLRLNRKRVGRESAGVTERELRRQSGRQGCSGESRMKLEGVPSLKTSLVGSAFRCN
jgi:hypothetical protein